MSYYLSPPFLKKQTTNKQNNQKTAHIIEENKKQKFLTGMVRESDTQEGRAMKSLQFLAVHT